MDFYSMASVLYAGGWKYTDKSELIKEYDLSLFQANEICYWLREFELRDNY